VARVAVLSRPLQRLWVTSRCELAGSRHGGSGAVARTRARLSWSYRLLQRLRARRVALRWLGALPPRRSPYWGSASGCSSTCLTRETGSREFLSWSSTLLQSSSVPHPPVLPLRRGPRKREPNRSGIRVRLSWGSCPFERNYVGCPFSSRPGSASWRCGDRSEPGERRQPLAGAVLRVLAPLDGSGTLATRARPLARSRVVCRDDPTLRGLVPCRSRPWSALRAFPSRGAVPALAGRCFLAGSRSTTAGAALSRACRDRFRRARQLVAERTRLREHARRMSRDDGSPRSLGRPV